MNFDIVYIDLVSCLRVNPHLFRKKNMLKRFQLNPSKAV